MAKEYIEREAACKGMPDDYYGWRDKQILRSLPAADVRENVIRTQADRIRAMSDEELAEWHKKMMEGYCPRPTSECPNDCYACWLDWLKSPAEDVQ